MFFSSFASLLALIVSNCVPWSIEFSFEFFHDISESRSNFQLTFFSSHQNLVVDFDSTKLWRLRQSHYRCVESDETNNRFPTRRRNPSWKFQYRLKYIENEKYSSFFFLSSKSAPISVRIQRLLMLHKIKWLGKSSRSCLSCSTECRISVLNFFFLDLLKWTRTFAHLLILSRVVSFIFRVDKNAFMWVAR